MKKNIGLFILSIVLIGFTSCLKDKTANIDPDGSPSVVEWSTTSFATPADQYAGYTSYVRSFPITSSQETINLTVNYSGSNVAPSDVTVTLGTDNDALAKYNKGVDSTHTTYTALPQALFSMPTSVVIPKGQRKVTVPVVVRPNQFDLNEAYVLPVSIKSATSGNISGNYGTIMLRVGVKNKYDGNYNVTATSPMVDMANGTLTGYYPLNSDLVTTGANSVVMFCYTYLGGLEGHPIMSGTSPSYYGSFAPVFTMDNNGNVTGVTNYYGQPAGNGRSARLNPAGVNKFTVSADGKTRTLEVSYIMVQGGDRTFFQEKWTFSKERE